MTQILLLHFRLCKKNKELCNILISGKFVISSVKKIDYATTWNSLEMKHIYSFAQNISVWWPCDHVWQHKTADTLLAWMKDATKRKKSFIFWGGGDVVKPIQEVCGKVQTGATVKVHFTAQLSSASRLMLLPNLA